MNRPIFLIGYMACGKTTLGRALAGAAQVEFVDMDEAIETECGMSVREIFNRKGEAEFRRMESGLIHRLVSTQSSDVVKIIACGGGTPCHGDNLDVMLSGGTVVWLEASLSATLRRIREAGDTRPLLAGMDDDALEKFVVGNMDSRRPYYARAHERFESSHLECKAEIDYAVDQFIKRFGLKYKL